MQQPYVCPAALSASLDNFLRRWIHNPEKILKPYVKEGMSVLDMGCGPGYFTVGLARLVGPEGKVTAADLQQGMLDRMITKVSINGLEKRVEAHLCKPDSTGIEKRVDFILAFWMVHEVPDRLRFLSEMKSLLNPGGKIFIAEPRIHVTGGDFRTMVSDLESAGMTILDRPAVAISRCVVAGIL